MQQSVQKQQQYQTSARDQSSSSHPTVGNASPAILELLPEEKDIQWSYAMPAQRGRPRTQRPEPYPSSPISRQRDRSREPEVQRSYPEVQIQPRRQSQEDRMDLDSQ